MKRAWRKVPMPMTGTTTEHFRCECGHQWSREIYDGLIVVCCPVCSREHMTSLGRFMAPIARKAREASR
jgi:hypothetical protein